MSALSIVTNVMLFSLRPIEDLKKQVFNTVYVGNIRVGNRMPCKVYTEPFKNKRFTYRNLIYNALFIIKR